MESLKKLYKTIKTLRSPDGCPWDRKQTHDSLIPFLFEECNEVADSIIKDDMLHLKEELGDLLLQILLHAAIAEENKKFSLDEVMCLLDEKLIRRHPHVFGEENADNPDDVVVLWESIKKNEKKDKKEESILDKVPKHFAPLLQGFKLQKEAAKVGFDWPCIDGVFEKLHEEIDEIKEEIKKDDKIGQEHEIGDLLFSIINLSRYLKIKPDVALYKTNNRFKDRFKYIEERLKKENIDLEDASLELMDKYWDEAKKHGK